MSERTLIERLNAPWPEHETEEVTLPAWVIELCAEGAARIAALEAQLAETQEKLIEANDKLIRQNVRTGAVKVKPLEWHARPGVDGTFDAYTEIGHFILTMTDDGRGMWVAVGLTQGNCFATDVDIVKAAAQADYERRILAALEPAEPAPEAQQERPAEQVVTDAMVARASAEHQEIFGRYLLSSHARRILKAAMEAGR